MLTDYRAGQALAEHHVCADCGQDSRLVNRWNREQNSYEVLCPRCGNTERFIRPKSLTALWRENPESVPATIASTLARKHHREIEAVVEGLPPDLAETVRARYFGQRPKKE